METTSRRANSRQDGISLQRYVMTILWSHNIDVAVGETVTCTFTNNGRATIVVKKVTHPDPDPVRSRLRLLTQRDRRLQDVQPVERSVEHDGQPVTDEWVRGCGDGFDRMDAARLRCVSDGSPVTNISLSPGEVVTCTFTEPGHLGNIIIKKVTYLNPDPTNTNFPFVVSGTGVSDSFNEQNGGFTRRRTCRPVRTAPMRALRLDGRC